MVVKKIILLNGLITLMGLLVDMYGLYDLSFGPAILGLAIGIIDCLTFVWMREEIKEAFRRLKIAEGVTFQSWLEEMRQGKPEVVATGIAGHSVLNRALYMAKKLGYEAVDVSELKSRLAPRYIVMFKREGRRSKK